MLVPVNWLKEYVNIDDISIEELEERLVMSGSKTECVLKTAREVEGVVVGKIVEVVKHPNADKLLITKVDVGENVVQIVTGAQNIKEGDIVPVALVGAKLPGGIKIKKGKLRGEVSNGMLCSAEELGFTENVVPKESKNGIFILNGEFVLGQDIKKALDLNDYIIEFEITPNRPDCLSMIGMARETAATFKRELKYPAINIVNEIEDINDYISIEVKDKDLCRRYAVRAIKDVKIAPSPMWLQLKLMKAGVRPINNIVDITNYVMLEYGIPLHAFDLDKLCGKKILVRRAVEGEIIKTLDGVERKLNQNHLVIADSERPVAIAGVMGGEDTEVTESTKTILLECANFNKTSIRNTSRGIGLRTEASSRFEKGIDPNIIQTALNRVCQLIQELNAGKVIKGVIDIYENKLEKKCIKVRPERVNNLIGIKLSTDEMIDILSRLELEVKEKENVLEVVVPTFRQDLQQEIDFVEEVARIYGYDIINSTLPKGAVWGAKTNAQEIESYTKNILYSLGFNEISTYSFVGPKSLDMIKIPEESFLRRTVKLINPLGEEYSIMRTTLIPSMMEVLTKNINRNVKQAFAFEIGRVFIPHEVPVKTLPIEKKVLTMGMYGDDVDFFDLKGAVCTIFERLGIKDYEFIPEKNHLTFHPGRCATIVYGNHILGNLGEIHPDVIENYGIDNRIYVADIDFDMILGLTRLDRVYKPLPKYPSTSRDMALVVKEEVYAKDIEDIIRENGGKILEKYRLFDVYRGKQIPDGYKSMAYSLTFRALDRTLTDEEVNKVYDKILKELMEKLNAKLR
ncbi:phenylalanyl-tRNA synthetase beta subunit [Caminicella sporogenes DSM 14501]|uniref:Phenylalanine--tRNA ligase beta subunit n=1 Tax=Caminicella sporogenes DSM 14501 TaxID=1121266 RepID=A0A1M6R2W8_9FIRM|nr:phenylalanine--tRNA ligase subunit beta [Caminicella sporogenes]RKD27292.1 phenylalanine--tRNA ligase subunit beta [Caminicella sporogenes]SHK26819.1 phenylalanyl-tRNA synthetase beta subunit [Caminicella sporogenes DSM 14501]